MGGPRVVLYSHDAMGVGHMRRNLLIADTLQKLPVQAQVLLIAGAGELNAFRLPPGVDCLTLPALSENHEGRFASRRLRITASELTALRANVILTAVKAFQVDLLIVDKLPRGLLRELEPALHYLKSRTRARVVLGLRDVLDDARAVEREWFMAANEPAIRDFYDAIWVYGDPTIYDPVREYRFAPDIAAKVHYTGYLDPRVRAEPFARSDLVSALDLSTGPLALCAVGGGQDGGPLAEAFGEAALPEGMNGLILTGPRMPKRTRRRLELRAATNPRLRVIEFLAEPVGVLRRSARVVAMGGYNTLCEILAFEKPALIVPRVTPRREQLIRAQRFHDLGFLEVLGPDRLTAGALSEWLARDVEPPAGARQRVDFGGLTRLPQLVEEALNLPRSSKLVTGRRATSGASFPSLRFDSYHPPVSAAEGARER